MTESLRILNFYSIYRWLLLIVFRLTSYVNASAAEGRYSRPDLLLILADDLGYAVVGFTGSTEIEIPVLDRLAHEGDIFQNGR
ncbi:MAG: hypothetical protein ACON39_07105 [Coraliomargaritaceae bacterium]